MRLTGKTLVITGAAGNIGSATARRMAAEGGRLVLLDRDRAVVQALADGLEGEGHLALAMDVTDPGAVKAVLAEAHAQAGAFDFLFANAGIEGPMRPVAEISDDEFDLVMRVNVHGVFYTVKYGEPLMRDGGSILLTSSVAGLTGSATGLPYATSKHAVIGIMRSAAKAYGGRGIRVNSIHPGFVRSEMLQRILDQRGNVTTLDDLMKSLPLNKSYLTPDDIAATVLYLASDDSRMVTGQTVVVDAGFRS